MTGKILEFDSVDWQKERNKRLLEWIQDPSAVQFIIDFGDVGELFDDLIDQDKPIRKEHVIRVLFAVMTTMPLNPFFDKHKTALIPIIHTGINAWLDATELEKGDDKDKLYAYVLRGWYVELLTFVIFATRGRDYMREVSLEVRRFFIHQESLEEYKEKLNGVR